MPVVAAVVIGGGGGYYAVDELVMRRPQSVVEAMARARTRAAERAAEKVAKSEKIAKGERGGDRAWLAQCGRLYPFRRQIADSEF